LIKYLKTQITQIKFKKHTVKQFEKARRFYCPIVTKGPLMKKPIWQPSELRIARANLSAYLDDIKDNYELECNDYQALHQWSIDNRESFWASIWDFCDVLGDKGARVLLESDRMIDERFFPDAKLNFAENLLRRRDSDDAIVFWAEEKLHRRLSWRQLYDEVSRLQQAFKGLGLKPGDRVAAYMANTPETVIAMLACTSLGATWCSCAPGSSSENILLNSLRKLGVVSVQ